MKFKKTILLMVLLIFATNLFSQGEVRKGLIFGGGLGTGVTYINSPAGSVWRGNFSFELRFGVVLTRQLHLLVAGKHNAYLPELWEAVEEFYKRKTKNTTEKIGKYLIAPAVIPMASLFTSKHYQMGGLGLRYFLEEKAPSFLFEIGFGGYLCTDPLRERWGLGTGFYVGTGYEFLNSNTIELLFLITPKTTPELNSGLYTMMLTYNIIAYKY